MRRIDFATQTDEKMKQYLSMRQHLKRHHGCDGSAVTVMFLSMCARFMSDEHWQIMVAQLHTDAIEFRNRMYAEAKVQ